MGQGTGATKRTDQNAVALVRTGQTVRPLNRRAAESIGRLRHRNLPHGHRHPPRTVIPSITVLAAILLCSPAALAGQPYRFDASGYLGEAALLPDWADTMRREAAQAPVLDACMADVADCPRHYLGLRHLLLKAARLPAQRQVSLISHYVNRKRYRDDRTRHLDSPLTGEAVKYRSRWATVEEFMRRGGDCEDFATAKYYLLRRLGFRTDQLRVVVTWDRDARGYHAVLAVKLDDEDSVLLLESDNTIRRGSRHRYRFIYSINEESIWDHEAARASASRKSPATHNKETSV